VVLYALGLTQLRKLDAFWRRRTAIAGKYEKLLAPIVKPVHTAARGIG